MSRARTTSAYRPSRRASRSIGGGALRRDGGGCLSRARCRGRPVSPLSPPERVCSVAVAARLRVAGLELLGVPAEPAARRRAALGRADGLRPAARGPAQASCVQIRRGGSASERQERCGFSTSPSGIASSDSCRSSAASRPCWANASQRRRRPRFRDDGTRSSRRGPGARRCRRSRRADAERPRGDPRRRTDAVVALTGSAASEAAPHTAIFRSRV